MKFAAAALLAGALTAGPIDESKVIDLTHTLDEKNVYWPNAKPFRWEKESWGPTPAGYWYAAARFQASEHGGTHLDSPIHFSEGKATVDQIPARQLIGPAAKIDVSAACAANRDYRARIEDIAAWEKRHGRIPDGAIVLFYTGWSRFWPNTRQYLGDDTPGVTTNLHFPGISKETAEFLVRQRKIDGVGIDTASIDYGPSQDFIAHRVLNAANVYALENVANLDKVPEKGATLIALPVKIRGGTGSPVRIIAIVP